MNIVICEDDIIHLEYIKKQVEYIICLNSLKCNNILCTTKTNEVMDYVEKNNLITLYFLDIDLKSNIDGFNIASKIREKDWFSFIVFITGLKDKANLTFEYKLEVLDYIVKGQPNISKKIKECVLLAYLREDNTNDNLITLSNKYSKICINKNDIYFIESIKQTHKIIIYYENGKFEIRGNLKDLIKELGPDFFRCNKSIIVNRLKIKEVNSCDKSLVLENDIICYYSKKLCKDNII